MEESKLQRDATDPSHTDSEVCLFFVWSHKLRVDAKELDDGTASCNHVELGLSLPLESVAEPQNVSVIPSLPSVRSLFSNPCMTDMYLIHTVLSLLVESLIQQK